MRPGRVPWSRRAVAVVAGAAAAVVALLPGLPATPAGASGSSGTRPSYLAAAEYFGSSNPTTMWSSDLSGAPQAFALMKHDGFNTVGLVLPWGEFQPGLTPPRYDRTTFARLDQLISEATHLHMGVILRLSYEYDDDPADQMSGTRFGLLWSNPKVYRAWLDYVAAVHRNVARFHNVRETYISWEDLWEPVFQAQAAHTAAQQLALATSSGYRTWLRKHYTLKQVEFDYGTQFAGWTAVPTPPATKPSFKLMYQYQDTALVHRLFVPASKRYPGLTMETRVDVDSLYTGTQVVGSYTHDVQYRLPGTKVTGMYFSPYMGDPSSTLVETATEALAAMTSTLTRMSRSSGGRPLIIYEYEFVSNSNEIDHDPALTTNQVPTFLTKSEPLLSRFTHGYALWTFRDYNLSPVYNPSFALGSRGWTLSGSARPVVRTSSTSAVAFGSGGGSVSQKIPAGDLTGTKPASVSFQATATGTTTLQVQLGTAPPQTVPITSGTHPYTITAGPTATGTFTIRASGAVKVTAIGVYWFTQQGDVYSTTGAPQIGATPLRSLNLQLTTAG
ncbi:MAG: hypothetical protein ACRDZR_00310 [Acidimicrobiales bacterium]